MIMASHSVRAIRGATTVEEDSASAIEERTVELLTTIMERNELSHDQVISILFTATGDLVAAFPATAARHAGFGDVPLICAQEIPVPGSMPRCVRLMMHVNTAAEPAQIHHIYLHDAQGLRDDLPA
jgi:chorismate mutase